MQRPDSELPSRSEGRANGVVVLGPGRSGTSSISSAFVAAGYFAGREDELVAPDQGNPLGHFEPLPVLDVNEELMSEFGCIWWAGYPDPARQLGARDRAEPRIASTLETMVERAEGAPLVIKEPRINSLLPLWGPVIDGALHPVLAVRDPIEVALSHARRDGTPPAHALAAWEAQMATLLDWLHGRTVTVAPYGELLSSPASAVELITEASAHILPELREKVTAQAASEVISPQQRRAVADGAAAGEYLTARQSEFWQFVASLPLGDVTMDAPDGLRAPAAASLEAIAKQEEQIDLAGEHQRLEHRLKETEERAVALGQELAESRSRSEERERELELELAESRSRSAQLEQELAAVHRQHAAEVTALEGSVSWRVTEPLRRLRRVGKAIPDRGRRRSVNS